MIFRRDSSNERYCTTRFSADNYKRLLPFLDAVDEQPEAKHFRFTSGGYMPLVIENLEYTFRGYPVYSMTHYGELNGDPMRDPDMTFWVDRKHGHVIPLSFQQDNDPFVGTRYQQVFVDEEHYYKSLASELDRFLRLWSKNILDQGFSPGQARAGEVTPEQFAAAVEG